MDSCKQPLDESSNSQMILTKHNQKVFKDGKPVLNCQHRSYNMFYICPDQHYHCIRCGMILKDNIKLRKMLNRECKIYKSHVSCTELTNHLINYAAAVQFQ